MLSGQFETSDLLVNEILDAPLGHVINVLENHLHCKIKMDLIEQNTPKPGSLFERKIIITGNNLPLIKAVIKFDSKTLPQHVVDQLLQKRKLVGTILNLNKIPNEKDIIFLMRKEKKINRVYQIKCDELVFFEVSEEIRLDYIEQSKKAFKVFKEKHYSD
jgi:chorismate-pyruvate lyase